MPDSPAALFRRCEQALALRIVGQGDALHHLTLAALGAGGNAYIEGTPGIGKTQLARSLAQLLAGTDERAFRRIQCTPDLLPADFTGVSVYNAGSRQWEFRPGPLFAHVVLADEINRATPKTQSGLLEAMEEGRVTVDEHTHRLPQPFILLATENPIEFHGTYPLPEAQLDRFCVRIRFAPLRHASRVALLQLNPTPAWREGRQDDPLPPLFESPAEIFATRQAVQQVQVSADLQDYLARLGEALDQQGVALGLSPRGLLDLQLLARAEAAYQNRPYVLPDDIKAVFVAAVAHRIILESTHAASGVSAEQICERVLTAAPVPRSTVTR
jgi:MoxR-like ATPase